MGNENGEFGAIGVVVLIDDRYSLPQFAWLQQRRCGKLRKAVRERRDECLASDQRQMDVCHCAHRKLGQMSNLYGHAVVGRITGDNGDPLFGPSAMRHIVEQERKRVLIDPRHIAIRIVDDEGDGLLEGKAGHRIVIAIGRQGKGASRELEGPWL